MRVQVNLSDEMLQRVDKEAKRIGTSRGAMLTTWIGEKVNSLDSTRDLLQNMFDNPMFKQLMAQELATSEAVSDTTKNTKRKRGTK